MSLAEGKDFYREARLELERRAAERTPADATAGQRLRIQRHVAVEYMMRHPWPTIKAYAGGALVLLAAPDRWTVPHLLGIDEQGGVLHAGAGYAAKVGRLVGQYHPLTLAYMAWAGLYLLGLWLLAAAGVRRLWEGQGRRRPLALLGVLFVLIVASAVPESEPRLRLPLLVPLAVLAGAAWATRPQADSKTDKFPVAAASTEALSATG